MLYESERIEYKSQLIDDIYKEVIAFANTDGGVIYIGIDNKGALIGIGFVLRNVVLAFIPMGRARHELYADYRARKLSEAKKQK